MKCKDGGSIFYKNKKYRQLEIEKKNFFSFISFQKFLIFPIWTFSENAMFGRNIPLRVRFPKVSTLSQKSK